MGGLAAEGVERTWPEAILTRDTAATQAIQNVRERAGLNITHHPSRVNGRGDANKRLNGGTAEVINEVING